MDESNIPTVYLYCFNVTKAPFDDRLVRQALALAVDRQVIAGMATRAGFRQVQPATVYTPPGVLGRDLNGEVGLDLDLDRARELLAQAGYPGGSGLPQFTLTVNFTGSTGHMNRAVANAMADMWRENLGLDVKVEEVDDWDVYTERLSNDAPQVFRMAWRGAEIDPDYYLAPPFYSRGAYNYAQLADPEFDALIERAGTSDDPAERQALYVQAEQELVEHEAVIIPLFHYMSAN
jgi:oligopeptide transport system substrate-binding protein